MAFFRDRPRTGNERELDKQNEILRAANKLLDLGGTQQQQDIAGRAVRIAQGRRNIARSRVQQERKR